MMPLISVPGRQSELCEFKASLAYIVSSRPAGGYTVRDYPSLTPHPPKKLILELPNSELRTAKYLGTLVVKNVEGRNDSRSGGATTGMHCAQREKGVRDHWRGKWH